MSAPCKRHPGPPHARSLGGACPAPRLPLRVAMVPRGPGIPLASGLGPLSTPVRRGRTFEIVVGLRLELFRPLQSAISRGFVPGGLSTLRPLALRHRHAAKRPPPWQRPPAAPGRTVAKESRVAGPPLPRKCRKARAPQASSARLRRPPRPRRPCAPLALESAPRTQGDQRVRSLGQRPSCQGPLGNR